MFTWMQASPKRLCGKPMIKETHLVCNLIFWFLIILEGALLAGCLVKKNMMTPDLPTDFLALAGDKQCQLSWHSSLGAASYRIYKREDLNTDYVFVAEIAVTSYLVTDLTNGKTYYFTVTAVNKNGETGKAPDITVTPTAPPIENPPDNPGESDFIYFLVSEKHPLHNDSYILPLSKPEDIAKARLIINNPSSVSETIVVARIAKGSGNGTYFNKDLVGGGKRWSWYITEFASFAEVTAEILDGWPTDVENNPDIWMPAGSGTIGFWDYTVSQEVNLSELQ